MTSWPDPHDSQPRLPAHAKDAADEALLRQINDALAAYPLSRPETGVAAGAPIVYVVGAPRSGTTLLSQLLSKYTDIGYITNVTARFWRRPSVGILLSRVCLGEAARETISLRSSYGTTSDPAGPHEFGYFWRHWLPLDAAPSHHLPDSALAAIDREGLRQALEIEVLNAFGTPALFKNVICGFHAGFLTSIHPASIFVHIDRDPLATTASILQARIARYGSAAAWWSLKPAAIAEVLRPDDPGGEAARQVYHCRREISEELSRPPVRALAMQYESLCADPERELQRVIDAVRVLGGAIDRVGGAIPALAPSAGPPLAPSLRDGIRRYFNSVGL